MPRLLRSRYPRRKAHRGVSLPYIYGIGPKTAKRMLEQANIDLERPRQGPVSRGQISEIIHGDHFASKLPH